MGSFFSPNCNEGGNAHSRHNIQSETTRVSFGSRSEWGGMDDRNTIMRWKNSQQQTRCERYELLIERKNHNLLMEINAWVRPESLTAKGGKFIILSGFRVICRRPFGNSFVSHAFPRLHFWSIKNCSEREHLISLLWSQGHESRYINWKSRFGALIVYVYYYYVYYCLLFCLLLVCLFDRP